MSERNWIEKGQTRMRPKFVVFGLAASLAALSGVIGLSGSAARETSRSEGASLGTVSNDGLALRFTGGFDAIVQKVIRQANSDLQQWEFCTNPPRMRGPFVVPQLRLPGQTCGEKPRPFNPDNAGTFSLYELVWSPTGTKLGERLSQFTFSNPNINWVQTTKPTAGKCMALVDARGNLVPIRSGTGDKFSFTNPFSPLNGEVQQAQAEVDRLTSAIRSAESSRSSGGGTLSSLTAEFTRVGGRSDADGMYCPTFTQRALPPRPTNVMSAAEVELQANGSCVDVMLRSHDRLKVYNALSRADRTDTVVRNYNTWRNRKAQCSMGNIQTNDYGVRASCGGLSDIWCYDTIIGQLNQCKIAVRNSCGGSLSSWQAQVDRIRREPQEAQYRCENALSAVQNARSSVGANDTNLQKLRGDLTAAQQRLTEAQGRPQPQAQSLSISQARCGG